jgi:hypothetical protein
MDEPDAQWDCVLAIADKPVNRPDPDVRMRQSVLSARGHPSFVVLVLRKYREDLRVQHLHPNTV